MVTCMIKTRQWWDEQAGGGAEGQLASWSCLGESGQVWGETSDAPESLVSLAKEAAVARCGRIDEFRVVYTDSSNKPLPIVVESSTPPQAPVSWLPTMSCLRGEP